MLYFYDSMKEKNADYANPPGKNRWNLRNPHLENRFRLSVYSGMLPCFLGGLLWFLLCAISRACTSL